MIFDLALKTCIFCQSSWFRSFGNSSWFKRWTVTGVKNSLKFYYLSYHYFWLIKRYLKSIIVGLASYQVDAKNQVSRQKLVFSKEMTWNIHNCKRQTKGFSACSNAKCEIKTIQVETKLVINHEIRKECKTLASTSFQFILWYWNDEKHKMYVVK